MDPTLNHLTADNSDLSFLIQDIMSTTGAETVSGVINDIRRYIEADLARVARYWDAITAIEAAREIPPATNNNTKETQQ